MSNFMKKNHKTAKKVLEFINSGNTLKNRQLFATKNFLSRMA